MALDKFRKIHITLNKANQRVLETQIAKSGDVNGRELVVQITNNGVIEDQTGTSLKLNWQHENGKQGSTNFNVVDIKTGKFSVYYPKEMLYKGKVNASIEISSNGQITNSMNFKIIVQADVFNGEAGTVNGVFISLADVNKKLDDREKEYAELKDRQTSIETQFNSVQQEMTDKDVISAPEIIAARNGEENLKTRIDKDYQEVTAQLAQAEGDLANLSTGILSSSLDYSLKSIEAESEMTLPTTVDYPNSSVLFPTMINYNGTIMVVYRKASLHATFDGQLKMITSTNGVDWSTESTIVNTGRDTRDPQLFESRSGKLFLKFFDRTTSTDLKAKIITSYDGVSWSSEVTLPAPPDSTEGYATKGSMTQLPSGRILACLYRRDGYAYIVKSDNDGDSWEFLSYISEEWRLNETALAYQNDVVYAVARQQIYKGEYGDKENKLVIAESRDDGATWSNIREMPIYGHAPVLFPLGNKLVLSYKNPSTLTNKDNKLELNMVNLKDGRIDSAVVQVQWGTSGDVFYSDITVHNDKLYVVYHLTSGINLMLSVYDKSTIENLSLLSHSHPTPANAGLFKESGWHEFSGLSASWMHIRETERVPANGTVIKTVTLPRGFKTRPLMGSGYLPVSTNPYDSANNILVTVRPDNATGLVRIILRNLGGTEAVISSVRIYVIGM